MIKNETGGNEMTQTEIRYVPYRSEDREKYGFVEWVSGMSQASWTTALGSEYETVSGRVGYSGTKIHALRLKYVDTKDARVILSVHSLCGSARWSSSGYSPLNAMPGHEVTCEKCKARDSSPV
jgi:hypothetical protein